MGIEDKIVNKELDTILQSPQFVNSEKESKLLAYLVKKTLAKEHIKEAHIAIDVFMKDDDFDPAIDSTVRVYVGKVRKKLETFYYTDESKNCGLKFTIPRGRYNVEFSKRKKRGNKIRLSFPGVVLIVLSIIVSTFFIIHLLKDKNSQYSRTKLVSNSPVWIDYSNSELPTLIVVGDFYFMQKYIDDTRYFVRNSQINTPEDFASSNLDTLGFAEYRYTYTPSEMSECIAHFIPHLLNNKQIFNITRASKLTWEDVNTNNIIFIGDFKTLYILNSLLPRFNVKYNQGESTYVLLDKNNKAIDEFDFSRDQDGVRNENILVTKRLGGNNNTITLILALGRGGVDDVSQKLCDPDFLEDLMQIYGKEKSDGPFLFDMVFELEGIEDTSLDSKVIYFNRVEPN